MSPTGIVAWWGAILSTIVFLWDIINTIPQGQNYGSRSKPECTHIVCVAMTVTPTLAELWGSSHLVR